MWSFLLCKSAWVTVVEQPKPCSGLDIITHLQITMMEALKLFVLLSSQKAAVAWRSCILMSSEIHHIQRCNREISMNKPKRAHWPLTTFTMNSEFVKAAKCAAASEMEHVEVFLCSIQTKNKFYPHRLWVIKVADCGSPWTVKNIIVYHFSFSPVDNQVLLIH